MSRRHPRPRSAGGWGMTTEIAKIAAGLTKVERKAIAQMPDKAWEPKGGTSHPAIQRLVRLGILKTVDGRWLFEAAKNCLCKLTETGLQVRAHLLANKGTDDA